MYRYFKVENFRCFDKFELDDLKRIMLVGGMNNIGKTSLLEAIFIHLGFTNADLILRTNAWRGLMPTVLQSSNVVQDVLGPSFHNYDLSKPIIFESRDDVGKKRRNEIIASQQWETDLTSLLSGVEKTEDIQTFPTGLSLNLGRITYETEGSATKEHLIMLSQRGREIGIKLVPPSSPPEFPGHFIHVGVPHRRGEDAARFSNLRQMGKDALILEALKSIEPRLLGIEVLAPSGSAEIYAEIEKGKRMPLPLLGDGAVRLVKLLLTIGTSQNGVILVDEFAFGLHYSILETIWKVILNAAKAFNVQVIATTHTFEAVASAHRALQSENQYELFEYIRLERKNGEVRAIRYEQESLQQAIDKNYEVR